MFQIPSLGNQPKKEDRGVQLTSDFQRILALPRRELTEETKQALADELTAILRVPGGSMGLRAIQGQALVEAGTLGGLFAPIRVGGGKTLLSLLIPYISQARRPLLLTKASLIPKTQREARELAYHWPIPNFIRMFSYELLGRVQSAEMLDQYAPDLIVADEAHKLKNPKAACTKRVARYMAKHPATKFAAMSGNITKRSLKDFAHILAWCLGLINSPVPSNYSELEDWSSALDEKTTEGQRLELGALSLLVPTAEREASTDLLTDVRKAYRKRLVQTPGVVATEEGFVGSSLEISALEVTPDRTMDQAFEILRCYWTTPDEWPISDPLTLWRHARELALGFYYKWEPRPPEEWIDARKTWAKACREILSNNRRNLDSEKQVTNAVDAGHYPDANYHLEKWRGIRDSFEPNTVPVWFDYSVVDACSRWALETPGIVWTEHTAFAEQLAKRANLSYYGAHGEDGRGRTIEAHDPRESLIASVHSNAEGRNLQAWNRNLLVSCPANGTQFEQVLGRTHRDGQMADEVSVQIILTALEHASAFYQATADAKFQQTITGQAQKLLYADNLFPTPDNIGARKGFRWVK